MENSALNLDRYQKDLALLEGDSKALAQRILAEVMHYRRVPVTGQKCQASKCPKCSSFHLEKIEKAVQDHQPISFVLPAFPGKSPNPEKVLGYLPDFAEELSLRFLGSLCQKIKQYYGPGIKIILCSDGRVFSDIVGIKESHISAYQEELDLMIEQMSLDDISTFNLDAHYKNLNFIQMRDELMKTHGKSLEFLKHKVKRGTQSLASQEEKEATQMYRGITRFLFEDSIHSEQTKSRIQIQKESRLKAYEVIRRSNAWSELIENLFPESIRLSIHPQICGSKKLGIRLIGNESWMTPWHGVAVKNKNGVSLLKRSEAEALGAKLVYADNGRPSHYLLDEKHCSSFEATEHVL